MILLTKDTNSVALYNQFEAYINKYISSQQQEEYVRNYSYSHISVLKLFCAFDLIRLVYKRSLSINPITNTNYTVNELISMFDLNSVTAELTKTNIDINDIWSLFFSSTLQSGLLSYQNKNQALGGQIETLFLSNNINSTNNEMEAITIYNGTTQTLDIMAGYENEPAPIIQNEWTSFTLSIRQNGVNIINFWWNNTNTPVAGQYPATISNIAGQIIFTLTPTLLNLLNVGLYDIRLFFIQTNSQSDIFDDLNVLNILA